jgi:hypothetical protein
MTNDETKTGGSHSFGHLIVRHLDIHSSFEIRHCHMKPRPLAVDAFRLCRCNVPNVCTKN